MRLLPVLLLAACAGETPICEDFPSSPQPWSGVLSNAESCGFYGLAIDEHMVVSTYVTEEQSPCVSELGPSVELNADPVYSNLSDDGAKYTWDVVGVEPTEGDFDLVTFTCEDGTAWQARVRVE